MKISVYQKEAIVSCIFNDIKRPSDDTIKAEVQAALVKGMSRECRALYRKVPKAIARGRSYYSHDLLDRQTVSFIVGDADEAAIVKPWVDARNAYVEAKNQIKNIIMSCTTLAMLMERFPEFEAYYPKPGVKTANVPAIAGLIDTIKQLGWEQPE